MNIAKGVMTDVVAELRAAGVTDFEGEVPGWGHVKLRLGALPSEPEAPEGKKDEIKPEKLDPIDRFALRFFPNGM